MAEWKRAKEGRIYEEERKCSYCGKVHTGENLGFKHTNKKGKVDWSVCFSCTKKAFDKILGKETDVKEFADRSLEKCIYCKKNDDKYLINTDRNGNVRWFICFTCTKKVFDKILKEMK